jgi:chromosome segregation ATPase
MAELNELLDKAVLEVVVLENAARATSDMLEDVLTVSEQVTQDTVAKGESCQGALSALTQTASELQQQIDTLVAPKMRSALDVVETTANMVSERAKALLVQATGRATALERHREEVEAQLEVDRQAAREGFEHVTQQVQALGGAVAQQTAAAHAAAQTLRQAVADARSDLEAARDRFATALDDAGEAVHAETEYYRDGVFALRNQQTKDVVGLANTMVDSHNLALGDLRRRLAEQLPAELWRAVGSLKAGLDELKRLAEATEEPLDDARGEIQKVVKEARDSLARLREFAESAKDS